MFSDIRFPEGHVYEDLATAHKFVSAAKEIVLLHNCLYYYRDRKGSICHTHTGLFIRDALISALDRNDFLVENGYHSSKNACNPQRYAISLLTRTMPSQDTLYLRATEIVDNIKGIPKEFTIKQKVALVAWRTDKRLFYLICRMSGRVEG